PKFQHNRNLTVTAGWASARRFHQSHISTVFIESIKSAPFGNPTLCN
ncbi:hypothetical protein M779_11390, partial [Neisseria gonorrhoeae MU_NG12]